MLQSATRYHWRVEVWDETGAAAGTAQSWFETGLLHRDDWAAVWIGRDPFGLPPVDPPQDREPEEPSGFAAPPLYLRREFELERRPVRARLYATARGVYEPRLNGSRVGDAELAPGWTEYHQRLQYQTYDVTAPGARRAQCAGGHRRRRLVVRARRLRRAPPGAALRRLPGLSGPAGGRLRRRLPAGGRHRRRLDRAARRDPIAPTC